MTDWSRFITPELMTLIASQGIPDGENCREIRQTIIARGITKEAARYGIS